MTSSFKQSSSKRLGKAPLDLGALCVRLGISPGQSGDSDGSKNSVSELSIRSSRVSLYLLGIAAISDFPSVFLTACLSKRFRRILTILFWCQRGVLAHVFSRRAYASVKQTFIISNIMHWLSAYQSLIFEAMAQTKLRFCSAVDSDY